MGQEMATTSEGAEVEKEDSHGQTQHNLLRTDY